MPDEVQDRRDILAIAFLQSHHAVGVVEIIAAMGHAEASLRDPYSVAVGICRAWRDSGADGRVVADHAHQPHQVVDRLNRAYAGKERLQRFDPARLDACLVHGGGVKVCDLLLDRAGGRMGGDQFLDHCANVTIGLFAQRFGSADGSLVRRKGIRGEPVLVHELVEVVAGWMIAGGARRIETAGALRLIENARCHRLHQRGRAGSQHEHRCGCCGQKPEWC